VIETHGRKTAPTESAEATEDITFLIYSPFPGYSGGRENWLHHIAPYLKRRGARVRVISYRSNRAPFYSLDQSGIQLKPLWSIRYYYGAFLRVSRLTLGLLKYLDFFIVYPIIAAAYLRRHRPERLVCMSAIPEGLAARLAGVPYVVSVRSDVAPAIAGHFRFLISSQRWLEARILRRAEHVLANGRDTQERLARLGITAPVVPNGVDFAKFSEGAGSDVIGMTIDERAAGRPVIAFIATLQTIKGADDAIACAAELKKHDRNFLLAMVGKGDQTPFRRRARELGVDDCVEFFGETPFVLSVLRRAGLFLGLSKENGMSMSALEAMAAGVPVVARDVLTYQQLIRHEISGLLGRDPKDLAECCLRMLRDPEAGRAMAAIAQEEAQKHDWPVVADALLEQLHGTD
jgi:glycosyltransferase involved in cell wall biosynthesis